MKILLCALPAITLISGTIVSTTPAQSAPAAAHYLAGASPITLARQRCGEGMKRAGHVWQDKGGAWHGPCVPKHGASAGGVSQDSGAAPKGQP